MKVRGQLAMSGFIYHVGSGDQIQFFSFGSKHPYMLNHLLGPYFCHCRQSH